jgi:hypothetical protein
MTDSTDFHQAYDSTREVLQNVSTDAIGVVIAALMLGLVMFLGLSKRVGIINLNLFK